MTSLLSRKKHAGQEFTSYLVPLKSTEIQQQPPGFYEEDRKIGTLGVIDYGRDERVNN